MQFASTMQRLQIGGIKAENESASWREVWSPTCCTVNQSHILFCDLGKQECQCWIGQSLLQQGVQSGVCSQDHALGKSKGFHEICTCPVASQEDCCLVDDTCLHVRHFSHSMILYAFLLLLLHADTFQQNAQRSWVPHQTARADSFDNAAVDLANFWKLSWCQLGCIEVGQLTELTLALLDIDQQRWLHDRLDESLQSQFYEQCGCWKGQVLLCLQIVVLAQNTRYLWNDISKTLQDVLDTTCRDGIS